MSSLKRTSAVPIILGSFVIFFAGYFSSTFVDASTTYKPDLTKFWEAASVMQSHYPFKEKVPTQAKQIDGAISGLVASYGDPYTTYLSKSQLKSLKDSVEGSFSGIGIEVGMKDGLLTVITPIKGSPAEKAGFLTGDIIYKVNNNDVSNLSIEDIIQKIRGPKGTSISIEIVRKGAPKPITLTPVRDTISIPTTKSETKENIEIISLYTFTRESVDQILGMLRTANDNKRDAIILDLRGNPGGLLDSSIEIGSMILPKGSVIVRERPGQEKGKTEDLFKSEGYDILNPKTKIVVLLNEGSASASEILAGALQDHKRATIIGTQSFGKGSVQEIVDMTDGSGIKVTVAKWFTPNNNTISEKGITPDIVIADTDMLDANDEVLTRAIDFIKTGK